MKEEILLDYPVTESSSAFSDYELECDKPIPNIVHASIQANLVFQLKLT